MDWKSELNTVMRGPNGAKLEDPNTWTRITEAIREFATELEKNGRKTDLQAGPEQVQLTSFSRHGMEFSLSVTEPGRPFLSFVSTGTTATKVAIADPSFNKERMLAVILSLYSGSWRTAGLPGATLDLLGANRWP